MAVAGLHDVSTFDSSFLGESERVRIVKEWVEMNIQQRGTNTEIVSQIEQVRDGVVVGERRALRRLCGRQTLVDLLVKAQRQRQKELQWLIDRRPVSDFAFRNRIQSVLRGRFLRNERMVHDEKPASFAASELGVLRQRQSVSDLREGFMSKRDDCSNCQVNRSQPNEHYYQHKLANEGGESNRSYTVQTDEESEQILEQGVHTHEANAHQENGLIQNLERNDFNEGLQVIVVEEDSEGQVLQDHGGMDVSERNNSDDFSWQGSVISAEEPRELETEHEEINIQQLSAEEFMEFSEGPRENGSGSWEESVTDQWYEDNVEDTHEWQDNTAPARSVDAFYITEDDNVYSMELRELLSRRRVSNLLQSGFRESLNQLIQSYVERQGHASDDIELDRHQDDDNNEEDQDERNGIERDNPLDTTSSPESLSIPIWEQQLTESNMFHHNPHQHPETEWEIVNELRINMTRLHQRMDNMQRMLEACMEMQVELQRSVRQEVSAALNRFSPKPDGDGVCEGIDMKDISKWDNVRKGICCLCCKSNIDSLLYRCGHMCTCSECAEKLVQGQGNCPMCRAPVVEMIRAYYIQ